MKYRYLLLSALLFPAFPLAAKQTQQYVSLSSAEKSYYALAFSYAMSTVETGKAYEWKTYSGGGNISPENTFISRSGSECREFTETYTVQGVQGENIGVGCKRKGAEGWCRLGLKQALTCAMEKRNSFDIDIPVVNLKSPDINVNTPTIGGTGSASPNAPSAPNALGGGGTSKGTTGEDVADTVTGAAGSVAGPAASGMLGWFNDTFR